MKKIETAEELRRVQMGIMAYVDGICRANGILYSLAGGTLIGAVRHKGFIPWDDDVDIMLVRSDYEKLVECIQEDKDSVYTILTHGTDHSFNYPFAKVIDTRTVLSENARDVADTGVFVDVFPIDNLPDERWKGEWIRRRIRLLYNVLSLKRLFVDKERSLLKNIVVVISRIVLKPFPNDWVIKRMETMARKFETVKTLRMACLVWGYGKKEILPATVHDSHLDLQFEDMRLMAVKDYDVYLSNLYGSYMQLPPEDKRESHHDFEAYWK